MSNTITAFFKGRVGVAEAVYQNDYGIVMNLDGLDLPAHFDCYFSTLGEDEAIPGIGADNQVAIPNGCLSRSGSVTLHIPLHTGANDSEVEYIVYFKVIGRARPVDDGTPAQMTAIEQALALLQNPIGNIEQIVNEALSFTGDTFAEMQEQLDADQAAFQSDMGDRADAFEAEIRSDISDVESDFDNLNAQFQTAVSALTVDDELLNVRVGDDNVTYTTAGEAVRKQFADLKSELNQNIVALDNGKSLFQYVWGSIASDGSINSIYHNRVVTPDYHKFERDAYIDLASGYGAICALYNNDYSLKSRTVYSVSFAIPANTYFRVAIFNDNVTPTKISDFSDKLIFKSNIQIAIENASNSIRANKYAAFNIGQLVLSDFSINLSERRRASMVFDSSNVEFPVEIVYKANPNYTLTLYSFDGTSSVNMGQIANSLRLTDDTLQYAISAYIAPDATQKFSVDDIENINQMILLKSYYTIGDVGNLNLQNTVCNVEAALVSESSQTKYKVIYGPFEKDAKYTIHIQTSGTLTSARYLAVYMSDGTQLVTDERIWRTTPSQAVGEYEFEYTSENNYRNLLVALFEFVGDMTLNIVVKKDVQLDDVMEVLAYSTETFVKRKIFSDNLISIFESFAVIGDSLACGFVSDGQGHVYNSNTARNAGRNWPTYLSLDINRPITNLARGSSTAKAWRYGDTTLDVDISTANIDTYCYMVGIGVNDARQNLSVGSSADIAVDKQNNADSFYGNYDYVIRRLREYKNARIASAQIFVFTIPSAENNVAAYNDAIRYVASLYTDVHVIDLATLYSAEFASPPLSSLWIGGHSRPLAYAYVSRIIKDAINDYMYENPTLFAYTPWLPLS